MGCAKQAQKEAVTVDSDVELIDAWIIAARDSVNLSMDERKNLLQQAKDKAFALANDSLRVDWFFWISLASDILSDSLEFRKTNQQVMELAEKFKMHSVLGNSHWDMAYLFSSHGVLDSAFYH